MKTITQTCLSCQEPFEAALKEVNRGNGKYCSKTCFGKHNSLKLSEKYSELNTPNVECAYCKHQFYKNKSKQSKSKSGLYFCSRAHKDLAQSISFGLDSIQPEHYGDGSFNYREIAKRSSPLVCCYCGYNKHPEILEVHHKDRDRTNNSIENLIILCPNCHMEDHFLNKDGRWKTNA